MATRGHSQVPVVVKLGLAWDCAAPSSLTAWSLCSGDIEDIPDHKSKTNDRESGARGQPGGSLGFLIMSYHLAVTS